MLRFLSTGLAVFSLFALTILYQNCGSGFQAQSVRTKQYDVVKLEQLRSLSTDEKLTICDQPLNYKCVERHYVPKVESKQLVEEKCFSVPSAGGSFCLPVQFNVYNTDHALSECFDCSEKDAAPGGRYNYQEIHCVNAALESQTQVHDRFDSNSVEHALQAAHFNCHQLLQSSGN